MERKRRSFRPRQTKRYKEMKQRNRTHRAAYFNPLQHHHLLLRLESIHAPGPNDVNHERERIMRLVRDLGMKPLDKPHVYYMSSPSWNQGLTAIVPIQTSHISLHFWTSPDANVLHNSQSKCLLQMDIYTCGALPHDVIPILLRELGSLKPTHLDCTIFNRKYRLLKELDIHWDTTESPWNEWLEQFNIEPL